MRWITSIIKNVELQDSMITL